MGDKTGIEWTDATWNPVTGCTKVSAGCKHCYAERVFPRAYAGQTVEEKCPVCEGDGWCQEFDDEVMQVVAEHDCYECGGTGIAPDSRPRRFTDVRCHPERLDQPLRWRKPRRVFVNSMSDLFHEDIPDDFIVEVWLTMIHSPQHTFQILTKRPERMRQVVRDVIIGVDRFTSVPWAPIPNVWLGVSVEDQETADERIPILLETPAAVRFVSYEPALGPVDFRVLHARGVKMDALGGDVTHIPSGDIYTCTPSVLDWIIVGGESGPKARPFDIQWARDTITQCQAAGVPVFVKQLGKRPVYQFADRPPNPARHLWDHPHGYILPLSHRAGGDWSEWPPDLRVREFPV